MPPARSRPMTRVLLLIPSASYRVTDFMEAARRLDLEVVVGSDHGQPLAEMFPGRTLTASFHNPAGGAVQIAKFADTYPLDAIIAVDDGGAVLAAAAAERLDIPANAVSAVEATRNKALLRERLRTARLPAPQFRVYSLDEAPADCGEDLEFPCVVKPLSLAGSRGVMRADDCDGFLAAVARLQALLERPEVTHECGDTAREYLVEDYIPGEEVALEALITDGSLHPLALFDKPDALEGPFFEETIYVTPSRLPEARQREVAEAAQRACRALGILNGPVHAEFRLNDAGVWPIDIAARTIGGLCARALRFGEGADDRAPLEEIVLRHAAGLPIASFEREAAASGVMMIPIPRAGRLRAVHGREEARAVPHVQDVVITVAAGRELVPVPEGAEYLGFIFARAETPEAVESALREAHAALRFEIEPPGNV